MYERERKAYEFNTLPKFIFKNSLEQWDNFETVIVQRPNSCLINPFQWYREINSTATVPLTLQKPTEICQFYVLFNPVFIHFMLHEHGDIFHYSAMFQLSSDEEDAVRRIWEERSHGFQEWINTYQNEKLRFRKLFEHNRKDYDSLEAAGDIECFNYQRSGIIQSFQIVTEDGDNHIQLSTEIYLVVSKNEYQIYHDETYPWPLKAPSEDNMVYVHSKTWGVLEVWKTEDGTLRVDIHSNQTPHLEDFRHLFPKCFRVEAIEESWSGYFRFPKMLIESVIWKDLLDTHIFFIDSSVTYDDRSVITGSLTMYVKKYRVKFTETSHELRILFHKVESSKDIDYLKKVLCKSLALYRYLYQDRVEEYRRRIPTLQFQTILSLENVSDLYNRPLKIVAPEMFLPNYSRCCEVLPRIVSPEEVADLKSRGIPVMRFPKEEESLPGYYFSVHPSEKKHKFIGLRRNPLANKDIYPILPACFQQRQTNKKTSLFYQYYLDPAIRLSDFTKREKQQQQVQDHIRSKKFLFPTQTGNCPELIQELFNSFGKHIPVQRIGVHRSPYSLLECILAALNINQFKALSSAKQRAMVQREYERCFIENRAIVQVVCRQEFAAKPNAMSEEDPYLNPRLYCSALEYFYDCSLVLFSNDDFIYPFCSHGFLKWPYSKIQKRRLVMIYEHLGSESNRAEYPQCEYLSANSPQIQKIYGRSFHFVSFHGPQPTRQYFDHYGKVYAINNNDDVIKLQYRVPPFPHVEISEKKSAHSHMKNPPRINESYLKCLQEERNRKYKFPPVSDNPCAQKNTIRSPLDQQIHWIHPRLLSNNPPVQNFFFFKFIHGLRMCCTRVELENYPRGSKIIILPQLNRYYFVNYEIPCYNIYLILFHEENKQFYKCQMIP